ncbi:hypothetical protein K492DRAFT_208492 [Lichtheimia hyalospora FSU 10163]|nr:hypothetical protein K492DRAFT_208492 [Lichtheimia hyalospora FSU 10163]
MDLGSLLNQGSQGLDLEELRRILAQSESSSKLDRITNPTFSFPDGMDDTYEFFDVFVRILLSIEYTDEAFGSQYTMTIVVEALRACINGLLQRHGFGWLVQLPRRFSDMTWMMLQQKQDLTILIYLYGLVLTIATRRDTLTLEDWAISLVEFIKAKHSTIMCHVWLNLWSVDDTQQKNTKSFFFQTLNGILDKSNDDKWNECIRAMVTMLKEQQTSLLYQIDEKLGNALWRPSFTTDECVIAYAAFRLMSNRALSDSSTSYHILHIHQDNPLLNPIVGESLPGDAVARMKLLQKAILMWMNEYKKLGEAQFNMYLQTLVKSQYPTDNKTILDALVAYWTIRDPYGNQQNVILDTFMDILRKTKYHQRLPPYYAYIEYFKGWSGRADIMSDTEAYNITAGAEIDVSRYIGYGNPALFRGCCRMLEQLSSSNEAHNWIVSCMENAHPDIAIWYVRWIIEQYNNENDTKSQSSLYGKLLGSILKTSRVMDLAMDIVPVILKTISDKRWSWLLRQCSNIIIKYFQGYPQLSTQVFVTDLLRTKSKDFIDKLVNKLQNVMPSTQLNSTDSRAWFANHFMGPVVTMVGDSNDESVALQLFDRILSDTDSYEFFLGRSLISNDIIPPSAYDVLHVTSQHNVFSVQHLGMVSLLHEMVQLRDKIKTQRLVTEWERQWLKDNGTMFSVPDKRVLQLIGLYDKAPAQIKQMIEQFVNIGIQGNKQHDQQRSANEHKFSKRMIELMMLGDIPEVETLFDIFSRSHEQYSKFDDDRDDEIVFIMISILLSIGEELQFAHKHPESYPRTTGAVHQQEPDTKAEQDFGKKKRKVTTVRKQQLSKWQSKMKGRQQQEQQAQYTARQLLITLSQRAISFLATVMEDEPGESALKEIWRTKLTTQPLFYESMRSLSQALEHDVNIRSDLQALVDRCVVRLPQEKADEARTILNFDS